ncbi:MAG: BadF/BadG/BcrA/BcrD ATPase family protein [Bilophila wadsworthia]
MPVAGVDVGSVAAKAVIFDPQSRSLLGKAVLPTGWNAREAGEKALAAACADAGGIAASRIVGTGYGRISLPFADKVVTEITCHARGAVHLFPGTGVVLDIGGQDSKVISTAPDGSVQDFLMNDKCAAGTGRFLRSFPASSAWSWRNSVKPPDGAAAISSVRVFAGQISAACRVRHPPISPPASSSSPGMRGLARIPARGECTFTGGLATALRSAGCFPKNSASRSTCPVSATRRTIGPALIAATSERLHHHTLKENFHGIRKSRTVPRHHRAQCAGAATSQKREKDRGQCHIYSP